MALREEFIAALDSITDLGSRNFTDEAPDDTDLPHTVLHLDISETPALRGDGRTLAVTRLAQLSLWELRGDESEALRLAIWSTLDGRELSDTFSLAIRGMTRTTDPNFQLVHRAFTIAATQKVGV